MSCVISTPILSVISCLFVIQIVGFHFSKKHADIANATTFFFFFFPLSFSSFLFPNLFSRWLGKLMYFESLHNMEEKSCGFIWLTPFPHQKVYTFFQLNQGSVLPWGCSPVVGALIKHAISVGCAWSADCVLVAGREASADLY